MFGTWYNHHQFRRFIVAFGSFFNSMEVRREDATGTEVQRLIVPLEYAPKERWFQRLAQDPEFLRGVGMITPRMSYEMTGITYDGSRKLNSLNSYGFPNDISGHLTRLYVGVPYVLTFELFILAKLQQDGLQVVEQILPYFTPDLTFTMQTVPDIGIVDQVPLVLQSISENDNFDGDFEHRRQIVWTLTFGMKVFIYGPTRAQGRIEEVIVDLYNAPYADLQTDPNALMTEDGNLFTLEDGSGHIVLESTPDSYLTRGRVARVDTVATDPAQDPSQLIESTTTITEYDSDVRRSMTLTDEPV